jgi:hypothetical protein
MHPPFTPEQFFDVFRRYNEAVWPAQIGLIAIALFTTFAAWRANVHRSWRWAQVAIVLLAAVWLWSGIVYHKAFFAALSSAGEVFGSLFIAEAGLLLLSAWQNENGTAFARAWRGNAVVAVCVIAYALLLYPILGFFLGHRYPETPTFGTPCPVVIFTFGVFCLLPTSIPRFAFAIPVLWALLGSYAAFGFSVREDLGLIAAGLIAIVVVHRATHVRTVPRTSAKTVERWKRNVDSVLHR